MILHEAVPLPPYIDEVVLGLHLPAENFAVQTFLRRSRVAAVRRDYAFAGVLSDAD